MFDVFVFDKKIEMNVHDIKEGVVFENRQYEIVSKPLDHGIVCMGYFFKERDHRKMMVKELKERGVPQGPLWGKLQRGASVSLNGVKVSPNEVSSIVEGKKVA